MAFQILLAGQDITLASDQMSVSIHDTLGQGAGAGSSGATQGRAATVKFNTSLGPMNTAVGAGQKIPPGTQRLVRQGEIIVKDASGTIVFGGYATKFTDTSTSILGKTTQNFTTVEGIDYSTSLQRTLVNEVFSAQTDIQIIRYIITKYAGWINLQYLPANPAYTFPIKNFRNQTVEQVLQTIGGITGYLVYVDYLKNLHYVAPTVASSAPFSLSDQPNFYNTFPHSVAEYLVDDTSAINRVFFYGGTKLSNDFTQDVSPMANGNNTIFQFAYYPTYSSDGKYHVTLNGAEQVVGSANSQGLANTLISKGGTAQVLVDPGSKTVTFDVAPATGSTIHLLYRYSYPLSLMLTDENSHKFFGNPYLDGSIDDNTIFDLTTAIQRCKVLLSQQNFGLVSLKVDTYKAGIQAGMIIHVKNSLRGLNGSYIVQEVEIAPYGGGNFVYHLSLGAWNWNLIDFLLKLPTLATFADDQANETQETVNITSLLVNVQVHDAWTYKTTTQGQYYARSAAVGDGHDAFPGFATITA
jgi:hypothetical protein